MRNRSFFVKNPQYLYEALLLRQAGWSLRSIADFYHVDRTSIRDHARKYVIIPITTVFPLEQVINKVLVKYSYIEPSKRVKLYSTYPEKNFINNTYADMVRKQYPNRKKVTYW